MIQVKFFQGGTYQEVEDKVNLWLKTKDSKLSVINIASSIIPETWYGKQVSVPAKFEYTISVLVAYSEK